MQSADKKDDLNGRSHILEHDLNGRIGALAHCFASASQHNNSLSICTGKVSLHCEFLHSEFGSPMTRKLTNPMLPPNPKRRRSEVVVVPPPPAPSMAAVNKDLVSAVKSLGVEIGKMANSMDLLRREMRMFAPPQPPTGTRPPREVQEYVARGGRGMNSPGRGKGRRGWSGRGNGY
jgi:hypothetical protein